jgi:hypothetical protein
VVCGLEVKPHHDEECAQYWVVVYPGAAVDCCGRELVVQKPTPVRIWGPQKEPTGEAPEQKGRKAKQEGQYQVPPEQPGPFLLYLYYDEDEVDPVPVLDEEGECDQGRSEHNLIRELTKLGVISWEELDDDDRWVWRRPSGDAHTHCRDDCAGPPPGGTGSCLEPHCAWRQMVPLALIAPAWKDGGFTIGQEEIDTRGRRRFPAPPHWLTHIVHINWPHGGTVSLKRLREAMDGRLKIYFDRRIDPETINGYTFSVQYGGIQRDLEFLPFQSAEEEPDPDQRLGPTMEGDRCVATFLIDPGLWKGKRQNIAGNYVYVVLKCDFVLDCHDNAVDGNHLGGRLPSGDGRPGGTFESWFRVVPEDEGEEEEYS